MNSESLFDQEQRCPARIGRFFAGLLVVSILSTGLVTSHVAAVPINNAATIGQVRWSEEFQPEHADVLRLYRAFVDREATAPEAKYWISQYRAGVTLDDIAWVFANGPEFANRYGNTTDAQFLTIVYTNVLGRTADPNGFNYWLSLIQTGVLTRGAVVRWIAASPEFRARRPQAPAEHYYNALIKRGDLPAGFIQERTSRFAPGPSLVGPFDCDSVGLTPYGAIQRSWEMEVGSSSTYYNSTAFPFQTNAEASNYLHNVLAPYILTCGAMAPRPATLLGQESFAAGQTSASFDFDYRFVRQGNVILGIRTVRSLDVATNNAPQILVAMHGRL